MFGISVTLSVTVWVAPPASTFSCSWRSVIQRTPSSLHLLPSTAVRHGPPPAYDEGQNRSLPLVVPPFEIALLFGGLAHRTSAISACVNIRE